MADASSDRDRPRVGRGSVHTLLNEDRTRIVLSGEVDASVNKELTEAVSEAEGAGVPTDVDARHLTFIDSSGVAMLARLASRTPERLTILDPPEVLVFLLEITKIGDLVRISTSDDPGPSGDDDPPDVVA